MPPLLWYQSDIDTADMVSMFTTRQADWAAVRNKISVFMFFHENVVDVPAGNWPYLNTNTYAHLRDTGVFAQLVAWNIPIGFGPSAIDYTSAHDASARNASVDSINLMAGIGAPLTYIDNDTTRGRGLGHGWTEDETVTDYKLYTDAVTAAQPGIHIGDVEPCWSAGDSAALQTWVTKCRAAGIPLEWLTLDMGWENGATAYNEAISLANWCAGLSPALPVQVIINPGVASSEEPDDGTYVVQAHESGLAVAYAHLPSTIRTYEVMSWYWRGSAASNIRDIPANLPETTAWATHTWLAKETATFFAIPDVLPALQSSLAGVVSQPALSNVYSQSGGFAVAATTLAPPQNQIPTTPAGQSIIAGRGPWRGSWRGQHRGMDH